MVKDSVIRNELGDEIKFLKKLRDELKKDEKDSSYKLDNIEDNIAYFEYTLKSLNEKE